MTIEKLSQTSQIILDDLVEACEANGWMEDQGTGKAVANAAEQKASAICSMVRRLAYLEMRAAKNTQIFDSLAKMTEIVCAYRGDRIPIRDKGINDAVLEARKLLDTDFNFHLPAK